MAVAPGDLIGDYEVIGELGAGGMGAVYKVRHVISQRIEALKFVRGASSADPDRLERFLREIRVLASLSHPNIAALHTAMHVGDQLAMIMEFVDGASLRDQLAARAVSMPTAVDYVSQALAALAYAHERGVVHRDVKPSNVMITPERVVKLLDFGIATSTGNPSVTRTGRIVGSVYYMSPEQISGTKVDARSDLYSLGATLYEAITGAVPIGGDTDYAIITGHLYRDPRPPAMVNPDVPVELSAIVMRALAKKREDRFQSAGEFAAALASLTMPAAATAVAPPAVGQAVTATVTTKSASAITPSAIDEITRQLAVYIGPIAKIIVQRAMPRCQTPTELCTAVAQEIESPADRTEFLNATRRARAR